MSTEQTFIPSESQSSAIKELAELFAHLLAKLEAIGLPDNYRDKIILNFLGVNKGAPTNYGTNTVCAYYKRSAAEWLIPLLDKVIEYPNDECRLSAASQSMVGTSLRLKVSQAWQYIIDHPKEYPDSKYTLLRQKVMIKLSNNVIEFRRKSIRESKDKEGHSSVFGLTIVKTDNLHIIDTDDTATQQAKLANKDSSAFMQEKADLENFIDMSNEGDVWTSRVGVKFTEEQLNQIRLALMDVSDQYVILSEELGCVKIAHDSQMAQQIS